MAVDPDQELELAETFADLARQLAATTGTASTLQRIVELSVVVIDGCEHAGISFAKASNVSSWAASDPVCITLDELQTELGEGPCLDAISEHRTFYTPDLSREQRWPEFSPRASSETGMSSVLSLRLFADEDTTGALNLYSSGLDAFDDRSKAVAAVFAAHAGVALAHDRREANLELALLSRDVIGQAKGILMSRLHITDDEAFDRLRIASQHLHVRLRDLAGQVAYTGEPPDQGPAGADEE